jgi:hypothetical protein
LWREEAMDGSPIHGALTLPLKLGNELRRSSLEQVALAHRAGVRLVGQASSERGKRTSPLMATRTIRARVCAGRIEPLEAVPLPEGQEVRVTLELMEEPPRASRPAVSFASWDLGTFQPLTRADIYASVDPVMSHRE